MTEYIYGMKNFIHDFSNLSEATQNELVLWDDYLVYAVVLEENQQIVNDIIKRGNHYECIIYRRYHRSRRNTADYCRYQNL